MNGASFVCLIKIIIVKSAYQLYRVYLNLTDDTDAQCFSYLTSHSIANECGLNTQLLQTIFDKSLRWWFHSNIKHEMEKLSPLRAYCLL